MLTTLTKAEAKAVAGFCREYPKGHAGSYFSDKKIYTSFDASGVLEQNPDTIKFG